MADVGSPGGLAEGPLQQAGEVEGDVPLREGIQGQAGASGLQERPYELLVGQDGLRGQAREPPGQHAIIKALLQGHLSATLFKIASSLSLAFLRPFCYSNCKTTTLRSAKGFGSAIVEQPIK